MMYEMRIILVLDNIYNKNEVSACIWLCIDIEWKLNIILDDVWNENLIVLNDFGMRIVMNDWLIVRNICFRWCIHWEL